MDCKSGVDEYTVGRLTKRLGAFQVEQKRYFPSSHLEIITVGEVVDQLSASAP
jgi:hypothetical protein